MRGKAHGKGMSAKAGGKAGGVQSYKAASGQKKPPKPKAKGYKK